jgi:HAD superfamily hydrolase (TIGR01549 family)
VNKNIKLILLDLDGVIIDSKKNMQMSWNKVRKVFKLKVPFNSYFKHIGLPFETILKRLLIKKNLNKISKTYQNESIRHFNKIKLYPGVAKTLKDLIKRKIKLGIVTSKDKDRTLKLIKKFKINIKLIVSPSKGLRGKPYPDQLLKAMKMLKTNSSNTIYVGDMLVDYRAAKNSGINFIHSKYGYGKKKILYKYSIKQFKDLSKII